MDPEVPLASSSGWAWKKTVVVTRPSCTAAPTPRWPRRTKGDTLTLTRGGAGAFRTAEREIHHAVDVTEVIDVKRAALACHASQSDVQQMLQMPREIFAAAFGVEHYAEPGRPEGTGSALPFA